MRSSTKVTIKLPDPPDYAVWGMYGLFWLLCGVLIGGAGTHNEIYLPEYRSHAETRRQKALVEFSNEILSSHSDRQACWALAANQTVLGLRGFDTIAKWAEEAKEQLDEGMAYNCIRNRGPL